MPAAASSSVFKRLFAAGVLECCGAAAGDISPLLRYGQGKDRGLSSPDIYAMTYDFMATSFTSGEEGAQKEK